MQPPEQNMYLYKIREAVDALNLNIDLNNEATTRVAVIKSANERLQFAYTHPERYSRFRGAFPYARFTV